MATKPPGGRGNIVTQVVKGGYRKEALLQRLHLPKLTRVSRIEIILNQNHPSRLRTL
jgi:hypothetical protein